MRYLTSTVKMTFSSVEEALKDVKAGKPIIVVDDEDRENEGDMLVAAEKITPEAINFMTKYARGLICLPTIGPKLDSLSIPLMVEGIEHDECKFCVSIDYVKSGSGISAHDRALTIKAFLSKDAKAGEFKRPGHIFPLKAANGGVLKRAGHTEAAVDLSVMAGLYPAGVICEVLHEDGTMARLPDLKKVAAKHNLKIVTIEDIIKYKLKRKKLVKKVAESILPTEYGTFKVHVYHNMIDGMEHIVLQKGKIISSKPVLARAHYECVTAEVFKSKLCDCSEQLHKSLEMIGASESGVLLYLRQEAKGIALADKLKEYHLNCNTKGKAVCDSFKAKDSIRDYGIGAQIIRDLGIKKVKLITNNPNKIIGLEAYGINVVKRVPLKVKPTEHNYDYMKAKQEKLGHVLGI